ncbi:MAG TPA: cyclic dehypoxanthinyl futalosine synthase [Armatimonadota bacterium]|jgi:cyclic dehypoxanthinyl futalosine synthase
MGESYAQILDRAVAGNRISSAEAVLLFDVPLLELGWAADACCRRLHPSATRTFLIGRNINYSNVCISGCAFCAFFRGGAHPEAYVLAIEKILEKVGEMVAAGGTEMLLQGGLHPELPLSWYMELFRAVAAAFPTVQIHALSPSEVTHLAQRETLATVAVLQCLQSAGLASIPGGGAEILVERVRSRISPRKCTAAQWLAVMREAHQLGMPTTATMMYGHIETLAERIEHLARLRALQDETGGFIGFIPWPFQPGNTPLARQLSRPPALGGDEFLRMLAISRLYLDNIPNLQSSWVTQGVKLGQMGLAFGANDLGSTMMEEHVVRAAGTVFTSNADELARCIRDMNFVPAQRTTTYQIVREWPTFCVTNVSMGASS